MPTVPLTTVLQNRQVFLPDPIVPLLTTQCLTMAAHIQCPGNSVLHSINTNIITC